MSTRQATACNWHHRRRHADAPVVSHVQPTRLRHTCATAAAQGVDLAVIDTPARTEAAALEAARVADLVVIPCRPQIYDVETIPATQQLLALAGHPSAVVILNAVPSRGQRRVEQVRTAVARFGLPVCPFTVGHRAAVGDAAALGLTRILCLANVARGLGTAGAVDAGRRYIVVYYYSIVLYY